MVCRKKSCRGGGALLCVFCPRNVHGKSDRRIFGCCVFGILLFLLFCLIGLIV